MTQADFFVHPTAVLDEGCVVGEGAKIWHFSHVMAGARIGARCTIGQNVFVARDVRIGRGVKIQNNVSVYEGVELEDDVFCGPSCVFTNVTHPRSEVVRRGNYERTLVKRGATIGANATIVCGTTVGRYAFIAAGTVVVRGHVPNYALILGVPGRHVGWVGRHGERLGPPEADGIMRCPVTGWRYQAEGTSGLLCLDWAEDEPLAGAP